METLLWGLLGYVLYPVWLVAGLVDYWTHQRTDIATTAGPRESFLHLLQALQMGLPVLIVLFLRLNLLALALVVAATVAHSLTAYVDLSYASERRRILPLEQVAHSFLYTLPIFAIAILIVLAWPLLHAPNALAIDPWRLQWRDPPWDLRLVALVLVSSVLFGFVPVLMELAITTKAARRLGKFGVSLARESRRQPASDYLSPP